MYIGVYYDSATDDYDVNTLGSLRAVARDLSNFYEEGENPRKYYELTFDDAGVPTIQELTLDFTSARDVGVPTEEVPLVVNGVDTGETFVKPKAREVLPPLTREEQQRIDQERQPEPPVREEPVVPEPDPQVTP